MAKSSRFRGYWEEDEEDGDHEEHEDNTAHENNEACAPTGCGCNTFKAVASGGSACGYWHGYGGGVTTRLKFTCGAVAPPKTVQARTSGSPEDRKEKQCVGPRRQWDHKAKAVSSSRRQWEHTAKAVSYRR